jgi:hypothetical protein
MFQKGNAYYAEWYDAGKRYRRSFDNPQQANKFQSERRAEVYAKKSQPSLSIPPQPRGPQSLHAASTVVSIKKLSKLSRPRRVAKHRKISKR